MKELNFISWNNRAPVYEIRTWNQDHTKYGKGIMITPKQVLILQELLSEIDNFNDRISFASIIVKNTF